MERFISVQYHGRNEMLMLGAANLCISLSQDLSLACTCQRLQDLPAALSSFTQSTALVSSVHKFPPTQVIA